MPVRLPRLHAMQSARFYRLPSDRPRLERPSWFVVMGLCALCAVLGLAGGLRLDAAKLREAHAAVARARELLSQIGTDDPAPLPRPQP